MTRTQTIGVLLITLGLIYAFVYAGLLLRARRTAQAAALGPAETPEPPEPPETAETPETPEPPETAEAPETAETADLPAASAAPEAASEPAAATPPAPEPATPPEPQPAPESEPEPQPLPDLAAGLAGRYEGTRVGRDRTATKRLGKAGPGTVTVGPEGVTWRPENGAALRADPSVITSVRVEDGTVVVLWHPDPTTNHQTGFTAASVTETAALVDALDQLPGICVDRGPGDPLAVPAPTTVTSTTPVTSTPTVTSTTPGTSTTEMETL